MDVDLFHLDSSTRGPESTICEVWAPQRESFSEAGLRECRRHVLPIKSPSQIMVKGFTRVRWTLIQGQ